jgi:hypothetical protein
MNMEAKPLNRVSVHNFIEWGDVQVDQPKSEEHLQFVGDGNWRWQSAFFFTFSGPHHRQTLRELWTKPSLNKIVHRVQNIEWTDFFC